MPPTAPKITLNKALGSGQCYDEVLSGLVLPLRMMQIPAGRFLMGSPEDELERKSSEGPQHEVTIAQFFMAKYPVTQDQWRIVASLEAVNRDLDRDPSHCKGNLRPVERVTWEDAVEFCDRLTLFTNRQYRLPSEAEWEYACRAGTTTPFHFGETITTEVANYRGIDDDDKPTIYSGSYGDGPKGEYRQETIPVDHFGITNAFGLSDMHGNVWEWCEDDYHNTYEGAPSDGSAWVEVDRSRKNRILRGGSWDNFPRYCRSAYRNYFFNPDFRSSFIGFRVVCASPRT